MTEFIGPVPIATVQEYTVENAKATEQVDLIDEESNLVISSEEEGYDVAIAFTLVEEAHPERLDLQEQKEEVKSLASADAQDNYFNYEGEEAFLSIGEISIPEDSARDNLRSGEITAKLLPYPKHFSDIEPGNRKRNSINIDYDLDLLAELEKFGKDVFIANSRFAFDVEGRLSNFFGLAANIDYGLDVEGSLEGSSTITSGKYGSGGYGDGTYGIIYAFYGDGVYGEESYP